MSLYPDAPPGYYTTDQLLASLDRTVETTIQNILDQVIRATLLQTSVSDWPTYLSRAIECVADEHNDPEQFLQELVTQVQALVPDVVTAESSVLAPQPAD